MQRRTLTTRAEIAKKFPITYTFPSFLIIYSKTRGYPSFSHHYFSLCRKKDFTNSTIFRQEILHLYDFLHFISCILFGNTTEFSLYFAGFFHVFFICSDSVHL